MCASVVDRVCGPHKNVNLLIPGHIQGSFCEFSLLASPTRRSSDLLYGPPVPGPTTGAPPEPTRGHHKGTPLRTQSAIGAHFVKHGSTIKVLPYAPIRDRRALCETIDSRTHSGFNRFTKCAPIADWCVGEYLYGAPVLLPYAPIRDRRALCETIDSRTHSGFVPNDWVRSRKQNQPRVAHTSRFLRCMRASATGSVGPHQKVKVLIPRHIPGSSCEF